MSSFVKKEQDLIFELTNRFGAKTGAVYNSYLYPPAGCSPRKNVRDECHIELTTEDECALQLASLAARRYRLAKEALEQATSVLRLQREG